MKKDYTKILISISAIFLIFGLFTFYSTNSPFNLLNKFVYGASLDSTSSPSSSSKVSSDTFFLSALTSLGKIKIDQEFFQSEVFKSFVDNSVAINPVPPGRDNPFAPIGGGINSTPVLSETKVITNQPSQILSNSAILNGIINISGVSSGYFKYGNTEDLKSLTEVTQSSVNGLFNKNILKLEPKTKYFFQACIKISNVESCGEVISFTTI